MRKNKLESEIRFELAQLEELSITAKKLSETNPQTRNPWDSAAAAKYVSDVAAALENLCKRRYSYLNQVPPKGSDSHIQILDDFFRTEGLGKDLPVEFVMRIKKYLRFRHRFVHGYGHKIRLYVNRIYSFRVDVLCQLTTSPVPTRFVDQLHLSNSFLFPALPA